MKELSFLPQELRHTPTPIRWSRLAALCVFLVLVGMGLWFGAFRLIANTDLQAELESLQTEAQQLKGIDDLQKRVTEAEKQLKEQQDKLQPFQTEVTVSEGLNVLNQSVPNGVVLTGFALANAGEIKISGLALSLSEIARFMIALEASKQYGQIEVRFPGPFEAGAPDVGSIPAAGAQGGTSDIPAEVRFELTGSLNKKK